MSEALEQAFQSGVREGWRRAVREVRIRMNQLGVDLMTASVWGDRLAGNAGGVGSLVELDRDRQPEGVPALARTGPPSLPPAAEAGTSQAPLDPLQGAAPAAQGGGG